MATQSSILAWRISWGHKEPNKTEQLSLFYKYSHTQTHVYAFFFNFQTRERKNKRPEGRGKQRGNRGQREKGLDQSTGAAGPSAEALAP